MSVCCAGCGRYRDKEGMLRFGLGWCCDQACRSEVIARRRAGTAPAKPGSGIPSAVRRRVRGRDGHRCRFCGGTEGLSVHHVAYRSEGGGHDERNLITLCRADHDLVHSDKGRWQPVLLELLRQQYNNARFMTVPQVVALLEAG